MVTVTEAINVYNDVTKERKHKELINRLLKNKIMEFTKDFHKETGMYISDVDIDIKVKIIE